MESNNVLLLAIAVVTLVNTMISARNHAKITEAQNQTTDTKAKVEDLAVKVDGRLTQLLAATAGLNKAVGVTQGKAEAKAEIAANENSQSTL